MSAADQRRSALVLSGGGANGAYEVGVVKALLSGKAGALGAVAPDAFYGTSVGSFNCSFLVSHWDELGPAAIANLERVWMERVAGDATSNGVYRFRADPGGFLTPQAYVPNPLRPFLDLAADGAYLGWEGVQRAVYLATGRTENLRERFANLFDFSAFVSTDAWGRTVRETVDFAAIRRCEHRRLRVAATNWTTGRVRMFRNEDMTDNLGPLAVMASSAIPGIFPPVAVGAEPYVDGAVLMNTPLRPALDEGADVLYLVYLDPDVATIPFSTLSSTVATSYRMQTISWAALVNAEVERAERINRGLAAVARIVSGEPVAEGERDELAKSVVIALGGRQVVDYRPITIHRFHPREDLAGGALGLLDLDRGHVEQLIDKGFTDATLHDCAREGCVLPDPGAVALRKLAEEAPGGAVRL